MKVFKSILTIVRGGGPVRRVSICSAQLAATAIILAISAANAATPFGEFRERHHCRIVATLDRIHQRGPISSSHNRFLSIRIRDAPQRYVQCIFFDEDRRMNCEAASGAYGDPAGGNRLVLNDAMVAALRDLGFSQDDPASNDERTVELASPPDFGAVADLMLGTLHRAFGADARTGLLFDAPRGWGALKDCSAPDA